MKKILYTFLSTLFCTVLPAQTLPSLLVGTDAASAGLGGITTVSSPNAWSADRLSASMPFLDGTAAGAASYGSWQPSAASDKVMGAAVTFKASDRIAFGVVAKHFAMPEYTVVSETGAESQVNGTFSPNESSVGVSAAYALSGNLSLGLTARMSSSSLAHDAKATVFGGDLSLAYRTDALNAGVALCNLGGKVSYGESSYAQPSLVKLGASYLFGNVDASSVMAGVEADYLFSGALMAGLGVEYSFRQKGFFRAGYHYGDAAKAIPSYASLGAGIRFAGLSLDLAYLLASETLGGSMFITLGYSF